MRIEEFVNNDYFEWLYNLVHGIQYRRLLIELHSIEFRYSIRMDENRADDGVRLRYRYAIQKGCEEYVDYLNGPCSVLEMMVALSIRCEEDIMDDPSYGDRTGQWFWHMIVNLGLGSMTDDRFDKRYVRERIDIFLEREYEPNGKGGLVTIKNCKHDLRTVEIWYQLNLYLDSIV